MYGVLGILGADHFAAGVLEVDVRLVEVTARKHGHMVVRRISNAADRLAHEPHMACHLNHSRRVLEVMLDIKSECFDVGEAAFKMPRKSRVGVTFYLIEIWSVWFPGL